MKLTELYDYSVKLSKTRANYGDNKGWLLKNVVPYEATKSLLFQAECHGHLTTTL